MVGSRLVGSKIMPRVTVSLRDCACTCKGAVTKLATNTAAELKARVRRVMEETFLMETPVQKEVG
jgi:hypothetical protein